LSLLTRTNERILACLGFFHWYLSWTTQTQCPKGEFVESRPRTAACSEHGCRFTMSRHPHQEKYLGVSWGIFLGLSCWLKLVASSRSEKLATSFCFAAHGCEALSLLTCNPITKQN